MAEGGSPERTFSSSEASESSPRRSWRARKPVLAPGLTLKKLPTFVDEVLNHNREGRLWPSAKELVTQLHTKLSSQTDNELIQQLLVAQYEIARVQKRSSFIKDLHLYASLHQADSWLTSHLGYRPPKRVSAPGTQAASRHCTRDIRLKSGISCIRTVHTATFSSASAEVTVTSREDVRQESALSDPDVIQTINISAPAEVSTAVPTSTALSTVQYSAPAEAPVNLELVEDQMVFRPQIPPPAEPIVTPDTDLASAPEIANALVISTNSRMSSRPGVVSNRGDLKEILNREIHLRERGAVHSRSNQRDHNAVHSEDEAGFDFGSTRIFTNSRVVTPSRAERPYPQTTDENTETSFIKSKSRSQRVKRCSFPECPDAPFRNARRHVRERHLPAHFGNNELIQSDLNDRRLADLL
ncbi:hypothetical protein DPMN_067828 [Dreissena polymorpha]|uniref:Uncharacterized protein n=1 Tax=Dreissena polymorpha TaxID=45954 RepID=A0A9D4BTR5_DREPO|nr:hypothetical protein DPMN_067828 [Dreissena polymorpha]